MLTEIQKYEQMFAPLGSILTPAEIERIKHILGLNNKSQLELRELRDQIVVFFVDKMRMCTRSTAKFSEQMSAATSVIDEMLCGM